MGFLSYLNGELAACNRELGLLQADAGGEGGVRRIGFSVICPDMSHNKFRADAMKDLTGINWYGQPYVLRLSFTLVFNSTPALECLQFDDGTKLIGCPQEPIDWGEFMEYYSSNDAARREVKLLWVGTDYISLRFIDDSSPAIIFKR